MTNNITYASFLIRLWSTTSREPPQAGEWQGEIQHLQSGQRQTFVTLTEMVVLLQRDLEQAALNHFAPKPEE
ncbi:MAG: hypothetical protein R3E79_52750 [Caldilineaceae bacterium]